MFPPTSLLILYNSFPLSCQTYLTTTVPCCPSHTVINHFPPIFPGAGGHYGGRQGGQRSVHASPGGLQIPSAAKQCPSTPPSTTTEQLENLTEMRSVVVGEGQR